MIWTRERVDFLVTNWPTKSAAKIGAELGCTRSAVIGKAGRMKLGDPGKRATRSEYARARSAARRTRPRHVPRGLIVVESDAPGGHQ